MATFNIFLQFTITISLIICHFAIGKCKRELSDKLGPFDIKRVEGEINVFIPCPYTGPFSPIWRIGSKYYEASNLPSGVLAASVGLVINEVSHKMNGTTFQCLVPQGGIYKFQSSPVGTLVVDKRNEDYNVNSDIFPQILPMENIDLFYLDHQHVIFYDNWKTIAWKGATGSTCHYEYQIISETCDNIAVRPPWKVEETSFNISSSDLQLRGEQLYFKINSVGSNGEICQEIESYIAIQQTDVTEALILSRTGKCVEISSKSNPSIALPRNSTNNGDNIPDCICPVTGCDLSECYCLEETLFSNHSLYACNITKSGQTVDTLRTYGFCFLNLNSNMNNTIVHIFESYRTCESNHGPILKGYRQYLRSFKLLIVLPNSPLIAVTHNNGISSIYFSSSDNADILIDHFQVIITDITKMVVYNETFPNSTNQTSVSSLFQPSFCTPYIVIVEAHNMFGYSYATYTDSNNGGDACTCIKQHVDVDLEFITEDEGLGIQINCSKIHYNKSYSPLVLKIVVEHDEQPIGNVTYVSKYGCSGNSDPENHGRFPFDSLECGHRYVFKAYWIPDPEVKCIMARIESDGVNPCPGQTTINVELLIALSIVSFLSVIVVTILIVIICVKCRKQGQGEITR